MGRENEFIIESVSDREWKWGKGREEGWKQAGRVRQKREG